MSNAKDADAARHLANARLRGTRLVMPPLTLHDAGERYDKKVGGGVRHLHVRRAFGVFEAAWEGTPSDTHRCHAISTVREEAEAKLLKDLLRRLEP